MNLLFYIGYPRRLCDFRLSDIGAPHKKGYFNEDGEATRFAHCQRETWVPLGEFIESLLESSVTTSCTLAFSPCFLDVIPTEDYERVCRRLRELCSHQKARAAAAIWWPTFVRPVGPLFEAVAQESLARIDRLLATKTSAVLSWTRFFGLDAAPILANLGVRECLSMEKELPANEAGVQEIQSATISYSSFVEVPLLDAGGLLGQAGFGQQKIIDSLARVGRAGLSAVAMGYKFSDDIARRQIPALASSAAERRWNTNTLQADFVARLFSVGKLAIADSEARDGWMSLMCKEIYDALNVTFYDGVGDCASSEMRPYETLISLCNILEDISMRVKENSLSSVMLGSRPQTVQLAAPSS